MKNKNEIDAELSKALDEMDKPEPRNNINDDEVKTENEPVEPVPEPRKEVAVANRVFANRMFESIDSDNYIAFNKIMMKILRKIKLTGTDWNLITYLFEMTVGYNFTLKKPQGKKIRRGVKKKNQNWIYPKTIMENTGIDAHLYRNLSKLEKMGTITVHQKATKSRPYKIEFNIRWDKWNIKKDIIRTGLEELAKISKKPKK